MIPAALVQSSGTVEGNSEQMPIMPNPRPSEIDDPLKIDDPLRIDDPLKIDDNVMTVRWKGQQRRVRRLSDEEKSRRQLTRNLMFAGMGVAILVLTLLLMTQL